MKGPGVPFPLFEITKKYVVPTVKALKEMFAGDATQLELITVPEAQDPAINVTSTLPAKGALVVIEAVKIELTLL